MSQHTNRLRIFVSTIGLLITMAGVCESGNANAAEAADQTPTPLRFGVDDAGLPRDLDNTTGQARAFREMGFDLWVCHARLRDRTVAGYVDGFRRVDAWCAKNGVSWVWNLEGANWIKTYVDDQGRDWFNRPDGRHYELIPDDVLAEMAKSTRLLGVEYDEPTHMQCCRNRIAFPEGPRPPWMYDPKNDELEQASDRFTAAVSDVATDYERHGIALFTEHVFSDLLHNFARAGYTPAPKILKESWAPIAIATAMGAAIQYDKELWITPDLWGPTGYPAHSVEEYRSSLVLAYAMGANTIYTENLAWDNKNQGVGSLILVTDDGADYRITATAGWRVGLRMSSFRRIHATTIFARCDRAWRSCVNPIRAGARPPVGCPTRCSATTPGLRRRRPKRGSRSGICSRAESCPPTASTGTVVDRTSVDRTSCSVRWTESSFSITTRKRSTCAASR